MKFLKSNSTPITTPYTFPTIETYIYNTKDDIHVNNQQLPVLFETCGSKNITTKEHKVLNNLRKSTELTIKPADKNLDIAILNTHDYLEQCLTHLSSATYQLIDYFPNSLQRVLENIIKNFKSELTRHGKLLYNYLLPSTKYRTPRFYGLPKIHKTANENGISVSHKARFSTRLQAQTEVNTH